MHDAVNEGDTLAISAPRNHFPLVHAQRTLLLAGGIGVTPLLCMAERLAHAGRGLRDALLHAFAGAHGLPRRDRARRPAPTACSSTSTTAPPAQKLRPGAAAREPDAGTHIYVCGPDGLHRLRCVKTARAPAAGPRTSCTSNTSAPRRRTRAGDRTFEVKIASSGATYDVPADKTVVQALAGARHRDPHLLRAGRVRHLHHARAGGRVRPPRPVLHRRGEGEERPVHALLLAGEIGAAGAGPVSWGSPAAHRQPTRIAFGSVPTLRRPGTSGGSRRVAVNEVNPTGDTR